MTTGGSWYLLRSGACEPAYNMAFDQALLENAAAIGRPVLRFYGWTEPAATFGYFQKYADIARWTHLRPLIRRPTGGGLVPHDADWTYSLVFPPTAPWYLLKATESYQRVHEWIKTAFEKMGIITEQAPCCKKSLPGQCFVGHEKFDVLWHDRKIAGAAQRRNREGLLIQGSVQPLPVKLSRADWEEAMRKEGVRILGADCEIFTPPSPFVARVAELREKIYSQPCHNERR
jgi:lipoyl(octanoyl) transferase